MKTPVLYIHTQHNDRVSTTKEHITMFPLLTYYSYIYIYKSYEETKNVITVSTLTLLKTKWILNFSIINLGIFLFCDE